MKWHQVTGIVITPMHTNIMAGIVGLCLVVISLARENKA